MTLFYPAIAGLCVLAAALLLRPLWWPFGRGRPGDLPGAMNALRRQLRQLTELHAAGTLTDEQFAASKSLVERKLLDLLFEPGDERLRRAPMVQPSRGMAAAMVTFVVAFAGAGYYWIGSPAGLGVAHGAAAQVAGAAAGEDGSSAAAAAHPLTTDQVSRMIDQLAQRLKANPDDADGWQMLARSYAVIGKHAQAVEAFKVAARLTPPDAGLLADYADALAMANNGTLAGEPTRLIERALKADPKNPKALALAGTVAFDKKDYKEALRHWEELVRVEPAESQLALQARGSIAEARELAGLPAAAVGVASTAVGSGARISGTITLADSLKARVKPDDTLFVFARASGSQRMPVAILRKRVADLPLAFMLDDSMAMSEDTRLSRVSRVVVGARISKTGNAMPQDGDLQGMAAEVAVGAGDVRVEINQAVVR